MRPGDQRLKQTSAIYVERVYLVLGAVIDERPKSPIERRKRNLKFFSPVSREERETGNSFRQFREGKENSKRICSTFERRKRNGFSMLKLREEKEKMKTISPFSRREREMLNPVPLFWEEKEKSRVHNFREEKEKFSFSDIKYPPKTSLHNSFPPNLKPWKCIFLSKNMKHFSQEEKEKQRTESHESRVERDFCLHNLENREEKDNWL